MSQHHFLTPLTEVHTMIAQTFQDAFSPEWIKTHLTNPAHALILLRHIIPWQPIMERLVPFYNPQKGRPGHSELYSKVVDEGQSGVSWVMVQITLPTQQEWIRHATRYCNSLS